jgi:hypothetical protein
MYIYKIKKYLILDPKPSDITIIRVIKARTGYRCKDIRRIMVRCEIQIWLGIAGSLRNILEYVI